MSRDSGLTEQLQVGQVNRMCWWGRGRGRPGLRGQEGSEEAGGVGRNQVMQGVLSHLRSLEGMRLRI